MVKVFSRRSLLKWSAALGGSAAVAGGLHCGLRLEMVSKSAADAAAGGGSWIPAPCWHDCGGRCFLRAYVENGTVRRVKTDDTHPDSPEYPQQRACPRGRSHRAMVFGPDRLRYPMKRRHWEPGGGKKELRGRDDWVRLSWDEALDLVAAEMKRIKAAHGNESIYCLGGTEAERMLAAFGGFTSYYGSSSLGTWRQALVPLLGTEMSQQSNGRFDLANARMIVFWGNNPAWDASGLVTYNYLQAKKAGVKFVVVDPFYSPTASTFADDWIPIRPATDTTMLLAMAHVLLTEDDPKSRPLIDWDFLHRCTVGFDAEHMPPGADPKENFKDYVLGTHDGQPKTPQWASEICGVPAARIRSFALELAQSRPVTCYFGWSSSRIDKGQHVPQAILTLGAMTGNVGIPGGAFGVSCHWRNSNGAHFYVRPGSDGVPAIPNPVQTRLCGNEHWRAILEGKYTAGQDDVRPIDVRMIYHGYFSKLNQTPNLRKGIAAHRKVDFVLTQNIVFNPNAQYSDIVLPVTTSWERYGTILQGNIEILVWGQQVVEPQFEAKDDLWIAERLGQRLGLDPRQINPLSPQQMVFNQLAGAVVVKEDGETFEPLVTITEDDLKQLGVEGKPQTGRLTLREFRERGIYQLPRKRGDKLTYVHLRKFREDPVANPLQTPTGKIQLHSQQLADAVTKAGWNQGHPIARYVPPREGYEGTFSDWEKRVKGPYPLQMCNIHYLRTAGSTLDNVPWLREAWPHELLMNTLDAEERGLVHGDTVRIFNAQGATLRRVCVTPRVIPGVVLLGQGGWVDLDENGVDRAGSVNMLSADYASGPDVESLQACNVQVEKHATPLPPDRVWPRPLPKLGEV